MTDRTGGSITRTEALEAQEIQTKTGSLRNSKNKIKQSNNDSPYGKKLFVNEPFFFNEGKYENFIEGAFLKKTKEDPLTTKAKNYAALNQFFQKRQGRNATETVSQITHGDQKAKTPSAVART